MSRKSKTLKFDEIGYWSELKLEIIEKYGSAYTTAFKNTNLKKYYIDAFSGAGIHVSKTSGKEIEGSPPRALKISPSFDGFYFIDLNDKKTDYLKKLCAERQNVTIHTGDCNDYLTQHLLPTIQYTKFNRALCLLDPYGLHLNWEVMQLAGQSGAIDMFLNFPVMDMNMNAVWKDAEREAGEGADRMNRFWGGDSWRKVAYAEAKQGNLFGPALEKQGNETIVAAFQERLKMVAGFKFVPEPLPMKNKTSAVVYYLFFASQNSTGNKIIADIFKKYR